MKILYSRLYAGCIALVLASASPALGGADTRPGMSANYIVTSSTSASGWTTVTLIPLRVECERIFRSVTMNVYSLGGTGPHRHEPARVTCDEREGHSSVRVDTDVGAIGDGANDDAVERHRSAIYVSASNDQTTHGPEDGHKDHQHVVHLFHDLE